MNDGSSLTESSNVEDANETLTKDSENSSVVNRVNTSTDNAYTFSEEIEDLGNGVWARGYVTISFGGHTKTVYTNSVYKKIS